MSEVDNNLSLQDLRAIIHGLKMSGFAFIEDEDTRYNITCMVSDLPCPEALLEMCQKPDELKSVREYVGEIMKIIDCGGSRDESFKIRYEAKKDMPPRYNVLKWRKSMNKTLINGLIKMSEIADSNSSPLIAEKAIILAKKAVSNEIKESEVINLIAECKTAGLEKEAQNWLDKTRDFFTGGPGAGIQKGVDKQNKQEQQQTKKSNQATLNSLVYLSKMFENEQYDTSAISKLINSIQNPTVKDQLKQYGDYISQIESEFSTKIEELSNLSDGMIQTYQRTKGQTFFQEEAAGTEETPAAEVTEPEATPEEAGTPEATPEAEKISPEAKAALGKMPNPPSGITFESLLNINEAEKNHIVELLNISKNNRWRRLYADTQLEMPDIMAPNPASTNPAPNPATKRVTLSPEMIKWVNTIKQNAIWKEQLINMLKPAAAQPAAAQPAAAQPAAAQPAAETAAPPAAAQPEATPAATPEGTPAAKPTAQEKLNQMPKDQLLWLINQYVDGVQNNVYEGTDLNRMPDNQLRQMIGELVPQQFISTARSNVVGNRKMIVSRRNENISKTANKTSGSKRWVRVANMWDKLDSAWDVADNLIPDPSGDMFDPRINVKNNGTGQPSSPAGTQPTGTPPAASFEPDLSDVKLYNADQIRAFIRDPRFVKSDKAAQYTMSGYNGVDFDKLNDDQAQKLAIELGLNKKDLTVAAKSVIFNKKSSSNKWVRVV